jgi:hypothetical protein
VETTELTTDQKGAIAEARIAAAAIELGVGVSKPLSDGERYDLIFDMRPRLLRVQCKWASSDGRVVTMRCCSSRRAWEGMRSRSYSAAEVDAFAAYCPLTRECYFLPLEQFGHRRAIQLRLVGSRNNQRRGINWAADVSFDATLTSLLGP